MLNPNYIKAIETRLSWINYTTSLSTQPSSMNLYKGIIPSYEYVLTHADMYYMDEHFCKLVENGRTTCPDNLKFSSAWMFSNCGFMYLADPFKLPIIKSVEECDTITQDRKIIEEHARVLAVGWRRLHKIANIPDDARTNANYIIKDDNAWQFLLFFWLTNPQHKYEKYTPWSYFVIKDGEELGPRVLEFENNNATAADGSNYVVSPTDTIAYPLHEIRWVYTAMYLMAQRLSIRVHHNTDRHTKRRAMHNNQIAPEFLKVITLRRLESDRQREGRLPGDRNWQWQWEVRGHWRNQYFPSENTHKPVFIESYIKGPEDKPFKQPVSKIFLAKR